MAKYRKKPVLIEAVQFDPSKEWPECVEPWHPDKPRPRDMSWGYIETLEGKMSVRAGDWIITGVKGEKYPCRADIFEATYEPADDSLVDFEPEFLVNLIRCPHPTTSDEAMEMARNCTPVTNHYWVYEGDLEFLGVPHTLVAMGVVGSLGGLTTKALIQICKDSFGVDVTKD